MKIKRFRHALSAVGVGLVIATSGFGVSSVSPAAAQVVAGACAISGAGTITPGLSVVPTAQSFNFSGSQTCSGVFNGSPSILSTGSLTGSGSCTLGSIEASVLCSVGASGSSGGLAWSCSGGIGWWGGPYFELHCHNPFFWFWIWGVWTASPLLQNPVTSFTFQGVEAPVGV